MFTIGYSLYARETCCLCVACLVLAPPKFGAGQKVPYLNGDPVLIRVVLLQCLDLIQHRAALVSLSPISRRFLGLGLSPSPKTNHAKSGRSRCLAADDIA